MTLRRFVNFLAVSAAVVLGAAAVWMGALNQDEGWYLYAANLVAEGKVPYRDFFYTQGPVMPIVYAAFTWVWGACGLLGARLLTLFFGFASILFATALARRLAPPERKAEAATMTFLLLGCNLYHLYYLAIPKTYALAGLFVTLGFFLVATRHFFFAAVALAFAAGTRISLGLLLPVVGLALLFARRWRETLFFAVGGLAALALVYGPFLLDASALAGLVAAQKYHAARGGFDLVWTVGSFSRLVRWYLPTLVLLGLGLCGCVLARRRLQPGAGLLLLGFLAVFALQMLAPFPYEDYQVPIMGILTVAAVLVYLMGITPPLHGCAAHPHQAPNTLLTLALAFATSFGSPLLEKWSTNGQDRFWSLKKPQYELAQLRKVAKEINELDPGGKDLLTQDLYLAIETGRKVPAGLEMGPFSDLTDAAWRQLLKSAPCPIAALSGYSFAIEPPACTERPLARQMEYWSILKERYELVAREEAFGQNATTLLVLKRTSGGK